MNFKPTLWKSIISVLVIILIDFILANSGKAVCMLVPGGSCLQPIWYNHVFDFGVILVSSVAGVLVYIIWSFFQKK